MNKRYQVFVSSTFEDLKEERNKVIQALLNFDCIPCGMEYFPAADEDAWHCIERLVPECDYYVIILGGKYGSIPPKKEKSYTHMEYELAVKHGVPVIALLHRDPAKLPADRCEDIPARRKKLTRFRTQVQRKVCRYWDSADQLPGELLPSLRDQQNRFPRTGWVRADVIADDEAKTQIIKLQKKVESQATQLAEFKEKESADEKELACGDDPLVLSGIEDVRVAKLGERRDIEFTLTTTWNSIVKFIRDELGTTWDHYHLARILNNKLLYGPFRGERGEEPFKFSNDEVEKIYVQLTALGLIVSRGSRTWGFTAKGLSKVSKFLALRKGETTRDILDWGRVTWRDLGTH